MSASAEPLHHSWIYRRLVLPILAMLRMGATPRRLAWSIAVGLLTGLNPLLGTTTVLCLAISLLCRLNVAASQLANHAMFPLELVLVIPMIRLGSWVFGTAAMPLSTRTFAALARRSPVALVRQVWMWEWHAFVLWAAVAAIAVPAMALALTPVLERLQRRVRRRQYPIVP